MNKKILGQYYTTNYEYILQNLFIPKHIDNIIEPFTGEGHLLNIVYKFEKEYDKKFNIECYDIDVKKDFIIKKNSLIEPPNYNDKFIITNPPYLSRNKCADKIIFNKYNVNDLYKCLIKELLTNKCLGGILIIPLNFFSSIRKIDIELRKKFLNIYNIILVNIFEEQVFDDTSYTVCSFQFELKKELDNNKININIYPYNSNLCIELNENNNYIIGGEIYKLELQNKYKVYRLTKKNIKKSNTNILVKCIDDNNNSKISLSYVEDKDIYIDKTPNQSSRTYATLIIEPIIDKKEQLDLITKFNKYFDEQRCKYNSLFLSNYRESKDIARKRISFDLVYLIVKHILENFNKF